MNTETEILKKEKVAAFLCMESLLCFTRYFYKIRFGRKFVVNEHHITICDALDKVLKGEITRLIINIAPRYSKTEIAVKNFIAQGLALNPEAKFIHLTYAKNLALDNSEEAKDIVSHEAYQRLFPVAIKRDSKAKEKWYTAAGGGVYSAAAGGQVTGFGAGTVDEEDKDGELNEEDIDEFSKSIDDFVKKGKFGGAIIIDDPIKPEDASSEVKRRRVNDRFESTIRNRVNSRNTPIIVIQQRIHENDLSGYLMEKEPYAWVVLKIACLKPDGTALWPFKHTVDELLTLKRLNEYVFESQYQQDPKPIKRGGEFYKLFRAEKNTIENKLISGRPILYNSSLPLHITFDFNVSPYMTCNIWQLAGKKAIQIDEICLGNPFNRTLDICKRFSEKYSGHQAGLFIYGDPSGKKEDTRTEKGSNDYTIIMQHLNSFRPNLRVAKSAPPVVMRGSFINSVFQNNYAGIEMYIGQNCVNSVNDYMFLKETGDGEKLKEKVKDQNTGGSYEKYGHTSDANDYFICYVFANEFLLYQRGGVLPKITLGKNESKNSW